MSGLDWAKDKRRQAQRQLANEASYEEARRAGQARRKTEQEAYRKFAQAHPEHPFCRDVAQRGRPITQAQAATLRNIAAENGWPLKVKSTSPGARAQGGGSPVDQAMIREARQAVARYQGPDGWLRYIQRELLVVEDWQPTPKMAAAILRVSGVAGETVSASAGGPSVTRFSGSFDPGEDPFLNGTA